MSLPQNHHMDWRDAAGMAAFVWGVTWVVVTLLERC
jgi:hypothetical protein